LLLVPLAFAAFAICRAAANRRADMTFPKVNAASFGRSGGRRDHDDHFFVPAARQEWLDFLHTAGGIL